jgi:maleate cis-trans isomerase
MRSGMASVASAIDYGSRARLGLIVPSGNVIAEPQIRAMLPGGVEAYVTRLPLRGSSSAELLAMAAQVSSAARLLEDAGVDAIVFHCTAVSTYSVELSAAIKAELQQVSARVRFATSDAIVEALRHLGARSLVLLTPYVAAVNEREVEFLAHQGIEVLRQDGLGIDTNAEMARLDPSVFVGQALRNRHEDADAYFVSCTAIRSAEVIEELESALQRPVITSNQAMVWHALRSCGVRDAVAGFGALLRR